MPADGARVLPGSYVDVGYTSRPDQPNQGDKVISMILLENVYLKAVDASSILPGGESYVTLRLYPEDAMKVGLALELGTLWLSPRPPATAKKDWP
jgi:Flp pilus assembly protein CpaB